MTYLIGDRVAVGGERSPATVTETKFDKGEVVDVKVKFDGSWRELWFPPEMVESL
jgi:hypothetical protein